MPTLEAIANDNSEMLLRELFYGPQKTRKTWLAGTAAEAGFNVILLDFDHGYHILTKQLSPAAKKRLMIFKAFDTLKEPRACEFITKFLKNGRVFFDEATQKVINIPTQCTETTVELNVDRHLNKNTVLIIDSYTALVASLSFRYAIEHKIDLTDPAKTDWDGFGWTGRLASWMLERVTKLPCHIIVVGHQHVYEKRSKDGKSIEWSRRQIKSTSGPHAMTIGDKFSDILVFENISSSATKVYSQPAKDAEGGARIIPPAAYMWEDITWAKICKMADITLPPKDLPYLDFTPVTQSNILPKGGNAKAERHAIKPQAKTIKLGGLAALQKN